MRLLLLAAASCLMVAGCAELETRDCRDLDWYKVGQRDGRMGAQPQAEQHAARCGVTADAARYTEGWRAGFSARPIPSW